MFQGAVKFLGVLLSISGVCPPSVILTSRRAPQWLDALNIILRLALVAAYSATHLIPPGPIAEFKSRTYKVVLVLLRLVSIVHYIAALILSPALGRCVAKTSHLRLNSALCLIPSLIYSIFIILYLYIWRNPFQSLQEFPLLFIFMSLSCFNFICTFHTVLIRIALQQHRELNCLLERPGKHPIEREEMFARVALKRMQINKLLAMVDDEFGPLVAATVVALSIRVAFSLFANFSLGLDIFSGELPPVSTLLIIFPRTMLDGVALIHLSHAGQCLKDEAAKGQMLLDKIITSSNTLPPFMNHQIRKCYQVFAKDKIVLSAWGLFNVDHSLISMIVSIVFALLLIQVQFLVSEIVSA